MTTNQHDQSIHPSVAPAPADRASELLPRVSGAAAILGGSLAIIAAILLALEPAGCVAAECEIRPMRTMPANIAVMATVATVLILGALTVLARLAARSRPDRRLARSAQICGWAGFAVLCAALAVQATVFDGDLFVMPVLVGIGALLILAGLVLLVALLWRTRAVPRWLTVALAVSSAVMAAMNEQTAAILFLIPFASTVIAIGVVLVARRSDGRG